MLNTSGLELRLLQDVASGLQSLTPQAAFGAQRNVCQRNVFEQRYHLSLELPDSLERSDGRPIH